MWIRNRLREWWDRLNTPVISIEEARRDEGRAAQLIREQAWDLEEARRLSAQDPRPMLYGPPMTKAAPRRERNRQMEITSQVNDSRDQEHDQQD